MQNLTLCECTADAASGAHPYRDMPGMLFAAEEFQAVALAYYGHITRQRGAWTPDKAAVLLTPKELAYIDFCVSVILTLQPDIHLLYPHAPQIANSEQSKL